MSDDRVLGQQLATALPYADSNEHCRNIAYRERTGAKLSGRSNDLALRGRGDRKLIAWLRLAHATLYSRSRPATDTIR